MQEYLFSPIGRHYLTDVKVSGSIVDLGGNFTITVSNIHHPRALIVSTLLYSMLLFFPHRTAWLIVIDKFLAFGSIVRLTLRVSV